MATERYLYFSFALDSGKDVTYRLKDPKPNLTKTQVETPLNQFVSGDLIRVGEAQAVSISGAYIREINTETIIGE